MLQEILFDHAINDDESLNWFSGFEPYSSPTKTLGREMAQRVSKCVIRHANSFTSSKEFHMLKEFPDRRPAEEESVVELRHSQLTLGNLLGQGSFSDVYSIKRSRSEGIEAGRCVVKVLREKILGDPSLFAACAIGLFKEGMILANLSHKNIVKVKGWSQSGVSMYITGRNDPFFIVLERLEELLKDRMIVWKQRASKLQYCVRHRHEKFREFLCKRLEVALDLAAAIDFIHQRRIVHRDLKPSNVGFSCDGTLKVFDFDVSRILPASESDDENATFNLTSMTGTRRYMSPECGLGQPYNRKTDVFSYALILYEILSLQEPFPSIKRSEHEEAVFRGGLRPTMYRSWPKTIQSVLQQAWSSNPFARPSMSKIQDVIKEELSLLQRQTSSHESGKTRFGRLSVLRSKISALDDCPNQ